MTAIPVITFDKGFSSIEKGSLHTAPAELTSLSQMSFYSLCKPGWSICPLGFSVYTTFDALGKKLVVPGIIVPGKTKPKRKFPNYELKFSNSQIEDFLKPHLASVDRLREERDRELQSLTHDLRALGTEIYHNALFIKENSNDISSDNLETQLETILSAQQMLSLRLEIIDYETGSSANRPKEHFRPWKKIDKVIKAFKGKASSKLINCKLEGNSTSEVFGIPIFELVAFVLMENALKYAPRGSNITVKLNDEEGKTIIRFESFGPPLTNSEKIKIFDRGFRGEAAKDFSTSGSGIGLFAAKTIVENHFDGKIFVNQLDPESIFGGFKFLITRFTIILPSIADNEPAPRRRFSRFVSGW